MNPFIIAELSCNHLGSFERALRIADAAAGAGADALKVQVWSPGSMCLDKTYRLSSGAWSGRLLLELYEEAWTPWGWLPKLFDHCRNIGIEPFGSPFDRASADFLESLGSQRFKIASFELVDLPLIRYVASKGKPMIMSTGMASEQEIIDAMDVCHHEQKVWPTLLKCTSSYPADASDANLTVISHQRKMGLQYGLSDHTPGIGVAVAAAALGATMIEKHLTLSRADGGPDAGFSMEPHEFKQMVTECRRAAAAIGEVKYGCGPSESTALRRSLYVVKDIEEGGLFTSDNIRTARPALGLPPSQLGEVLGRKASKSIKAGTPLTRELLT